MIYGMEQKFPDSLSVSFASSAKVGNHLVAAVPMEEPVRVHKINMYLTALGFSRNESL